MFLQRLFDSEVRMVYIVSKLNKQIAWHIRHVTHVQNQQSRFYKAVSSSSTWIFSCANIFGPKRLIRKAPIGAVNRMLATEIVSTL